MCVSRMLIRWVGKFLLVTVWCCKECDVVNCSVICPLLRVHVFCTACSSDRVFTLCLEIKVMPPLPLMMMKSV